MSATASLTDVIGPVPTPAEVIDATIQAMVASSHFCKSKRYPALLEYCVRHTLSSEFDKLRERVIGAEVFGRPADYDTNIDPVVRIAAGEVRKRIAQYFYEHPDSPVQIDLRLGSYVCDFRFKKQTPSNGASDSPDEAAESDGLILGEHDSEAGPLNAVAAITSPELATFASHAQPHSDDSAASFNDSELLDHIAFDAHSAVLAMPASTTSRPSRHAFGYWRWLTIAAVLACGAVLFGVWRHQRLLDFWPSVLHNNVPALIVVGQIKSTSPAANNSTASLATMSDEANDPRNAIVMSNTMTTAEICGVFHEFGRNCEFASSRTTTLSDLHQKTVVLVGAFDNPWTERLLAPLPIYLSRPLDNSQSSQRIFSIVDRYPAAGRSQWQVDLNVPPDQMKVDYFVIARFHSDITEGDVVVLGGIWRNGTRSAGEIVTSREKMAHILSLAPAGWHGENFEAVFATDVIQGEPGPARLLATHFW